MSSKVQSRFISAYADIRINTTCSILSTRNMHDGLLNNFGLVRNRMGGRVGALQPKQIAAVRQFSLFSAAEWTLKEEVEEYGERVEAFPQNKDEREYVVSVAKELIVARGNPVYIMIVKMR
jgi:hypothetical protein